MDLQLPVPAAMQERYVEVVCRLAERGANAEDSGTMQRLTSRITAANAPLTAALREDVWKRCGPAIEACANASPTGACAATATH